MKAKERKTITAVRALPDQERAKVFRAMQTLSKRGLSRAAAVNAGEDIIMSYERLRRKQASDTATDAARRVLVGARVPRSMAERCRDAAQAQGLSLYAWVMLALLAALREEGAGTGT